MRFSKKMAASAVVAASIIGAGTVAWAQDGGSSSTGNQGSTQAPSASASASGSASGSAAGSASARAGRKGALLKRVEHGDLIVRTKNGFQPVTMDRGRVTAASATSVTVQRPDGTSVTVTIDSTTKFRGIGSATDLRTGKPAVVLSHDGTAVAVAQRRATA